MHRSGNGNNLASVLKYHGKMWYTFAVPHFAVPNFAPAKMPPPPPPASGSAAEAGSSSQKPPIRCRPQGAPAQRTGTAFHPTVSERPPSARGRCECPGGLCGCGGGGWAGAARATGGGGQRHTDVHVQGLPRPGPSQGLGGPHHLHRGLARLQRRVGHERLAVPRREEAVPDEVVQDAAMALDGADHGLDVLRVDLRTRRRRRQRWWGGGGAKRGGVRSEGVGPIGHRGRGGGTPRVRTRANPLPPKLLAGGPRWGEGGGGVWDALEGGGGTPPPLSP